MKIAMLSIHSSPIGELGTRDTGGMSVYIRELAREIGQRGHRIDIFTRARSPDNQPVVHLHPNVRLIHLAAGPDGRLGKNELYPHLDDFIRRLNAYTRREAIRYDLVHSHYWLSGKVAARVRKRWDIPHVITFHTLGAVKNVTGVGREEPELRIISERKLAQNADCILSATEKEREQLVRYYDAVPERIAVVPCGVNLKLFRPMEKAVARRKLGFERNDAIILYVGRFEPLKGIDRLLAALAYLKHHAHLRLVLIGGDGQQTPETRRLKRLARELGVLSNVRFIGRVPQESLPPYYSAADVLAMPSHYESFGLVGLEALACGTPVVATPVGAMEYVLGEGEAGQIAVDSSPGSLAKGIDRFIGQDNRIPGALAIRASVLKFNWPAVSSTVLKTYRHLCDPQYAAVAQPAPATVWNRSLN